MAERLESAGNVKGLYRRTSSKGVQSWYLYRWLEGKPIKIKLGNCDEMTLEKASAELRRELQRIRQFGVSGALHHRTKNSQFTVTEAFRQYWTRHVCHRNARPNDVQRSFELHWKSIAECSIELLRPFDIQSWMTDIKTNAGPAAANRQFNTLRSCLRWGARMGLFILPSNLFMSVSPFRQQPKLRYVKPGIEYSVLEATLDANPCTAADVIRLMMLTGARKGNARSIQWDQIDFESGTWTIPKTKSGKRLTIPLTSRAIALLNGRQRLQKWVFPARTNTGHIQNIDAFWRRIRKIAKLDDVRLHDLRHTVGSHLGLNKASGFVIQRALGHSSIQTTQIYTHLEVEMIRDELERVQNLANG